MKPSRGWQCAVLKLMRAGDYRLTQTGPARNQPQLPEVELRRGGMLDNHAVHATVWKELGETLVYMVSALVAAFILLAAVHVRQARGRTVKSPCTRWSGC
jgi:hypothetical protein